jgi:hypothetical protein
LQKNVKPKDNSLLFLKDLVLLISPKKWEDVNVLYVEELPRNPITLLTSKLISK